MANWLDKYEQGGLVLKKKTKDNYGKQGNYNDAQASVGPNFVGAGWNTKGRNYSPAWGGQFQNGGNLHNKAWVDSVNNANMDKDFVQRYYDKNNPPAPIHLSQTPSGEMSTHYMADADNMVFPTVVNPKTFNPLDVYTQPGKLQYLDKPGPVVDRRTAVDYARRTGEYINFKNEQDAQWYSNNGYKKGTDVLNSIDKGKAYNNPNYAMGGGIPGAVGFTYARTAGSAPANGKYTKKTLASAQNGQEMKFYQEGLDFKPKSISKNGKKVIKDDMGQWAHPGEITEIGSNDITMQGVDYPVLGVSDTGDTQMMYPNQDYKFDGEKVTEFPMAQNGDWLSKYTNEPMRQDATRNVIPRKMTDKEKLEAVATSDQAQKRALSNTKEVIAERQKAKNNKGDINKGGFTTQEKLRAFPNSVGGVGEIIDEYLNPGFITGELASNLGNAVASRDPKAIAAGLATPALAGAMGLNPIEDAAAIAKGIPKATRTGLNAIDKNFNPLGKSLAASEKWGIEQGMSPHEIKKMQLENLGITSSQREAYVPGISDALEKYVFPQGYSGRGESKLAQTIKAIKSGMREKAMPSREDAWSLHLGKPQKSNTFRMAETAPINHPAYTPEELSKMDIYSINDKAKYDDIEYSNLQGVGPEHIFDEIDSPEHRAKLLERNSKMLTDPISYGSNPPVMGGFNRRLSNNGLEYNDVWDLEPELFGKKIKIDNFIGKPFMSHGVLPNVTPETVKSLLTSQIKHADRQLKPMAEFYKDLMNKGSMIDYSEVLAEHENALNRINKLKQTLGLDQDIMRNTKGWGTKDWNNQINTKGWLDKYK